MFKIRFCNNKRDILLLIFIISVTLASTLTACGEQHYSSPTSTEETTTQLVDEEIGTKVGNSISIESENQGQIAEEIEAQYPDEEVIRAEDLPPFTVTDYADYQKYIESIRDFKPYYQLVFDFSSIGSREFPTESVIALYKQLESSFDYATISPRTLGYVGSYEGDVKFVDGYDFYLQYGGELNYPNPINTSARTADGKDYLTTPLKSLVVGQNLLHNFDDLILEGRIFHESDYTVTSRDALIPVVLGSAYKGIYEIGDTVTLTYLSLPMNFEIIGFFRPNSSFSMGAAALEQVNLDYVITMPNFIPVYESVGAAENSQFHFHLGELLSGYIAIEEPITEINDETHKRYFSAVEQIAAEHGLSDCIMSPLWPVGFVFERSSDSIGEDNHSMG